MNLQPGDLVCFNASPDTPYQVVNVDDSSDCVWVRRFPLSQRRLPTFGVPADRVRPVPRESSR
ncbi:hypothetical protein NZK33_19715 [Cyanobium sp. FGCU-6]|jgi:hypothetical protein|nr:hypothetical protein [Cyanobium sp. FGCU6]